MVGMVNFLSNWKVHLGLGLVVLSTLLYAFHYFLFRDAYHIAYYLVGDIAFVPIEVLMVTLILHNLLEYREKQSGLKKTYMLIGVFLGKSATN